MFVSGEWTRKMLRIPCVLGVSDARRSLFAAGFVSVYSNFDGKRRYLIFRVFFRRTCVFPYFLLPVVKCEKKSRMKTVAQKNFLTPPPLSANIFSPAQQSPLRSLVNYLSKSIF